jgi:hypothetical protein
MMAPLTSTSDATPLLHPAFGGSYRSDDLCASAALEPRPYRILLVSRGRFRARDVDGMRGGVAWCWVRKWLDRRAGIQGVEPVTLAIGDVSRVPSRARCSAEAVGDELAVDGVADAPLKGSDRLFAAVALAVLAQVIGTTWGVVADLGDGNHVDGVVELAVAAWVEPVRTTGAAEGFDRGGGVVAGVVPSAGEPVYVAAVTKDVGGDDRPNSIQLGNGGG